MKKLIAGIFLACSCFIACVGKGTDYLPLAAGHRWQYESQGAVSDDKSPKTKTFVIAIASEKELPNGNIEFRDTQGKLLYLRNSEGIFDGKGRLLLKHPIVAGSEWLSGADSYFVNRCRVAGIALACATRFKTYERCLKLVLESDYFTVEKKDRMQQLAFESVQFYAPGIGLVQEESYELDRSRNRTLAYRTDLVSFERNAPLAPAPVAPTAPTESIPVPRDKSFRFPEQGYSNPSLSPDGRWIVFRERSDENEKWFYSLVGKEEKHPLSLSNGKTEKTLKINLFVPYWSRDGKTLVVFADIDDKNWVVFLDFSGAAPNFISSKMIVTNPQNPTWLDSGDILCIEPYYGQLMAVDRSGSIKTLLSHPSSPNGRGMDHFQATPSGIVLYHAEDGIFLKDLREPGPGVRVLTSTVFKRFSLSPDGRFALLYDDTFQDEKATLFDLATKKVLKTLPKPKRDEWSPDGASLAYVEKSFIRKVKDQSGRDTFENSHFFILDIASGQEHDLGFGTGERFSWTADSRRIVFSEFCRDRLVGVYEPGIFIMEAADGKLVGKVARISASDPPQLSADGKIIAWDAVDMETFFVIQNPFAKQ